MGLFDVPFCGFSLGFGIEMNFPNMSNLILIEADSVYVCEICRFLA